MKRIYNSFFIAAIILFSVSCTKTSNNNNNPAPTTVTPVMTANINSVAWTATTITASVYSSSYINIIGIAADNSKLQITVPKDITPGTYTIGPGTNKTIGYTSSIGGYSGTNGNIVITLNNGKAIKGTFDSVSLESANNTNPTLDNTTATFAGNYQ